MSGKTTKTQADASSNLTLHFQNAYEGDIRVPDRRTLRRWLLPAVLGPLELTFRFVDQEEGYMLNSTYRKRDYATNVLTFEFDHGDYIEADIVICVPVVYREAQEQSKPYYHHLAHMAIHGALHAQGYDHMNDEEAEEMEALEKEILAELGIPNPYND